MLRLKRKQGEAIIVGDSLRLEVVSINSAGALEGSVDVLVSEPTAPNQRFTLRAGDIKGFSGGKVKFHINSFSNPTNLNLNLAVEAPRELKVYREELETPDQKARRAAAFNV